MTEQEQQFSQGIEPSMPAEIKRGRPRTITDMKVYKRDKQRGYRAKAKAAREAAKENGK